MSEMSQRAYSRHAGVSLRAVQKAISSGRISVTASGKIDAAQADIDWRKNTDPSRVSVADQQRQADHSAAKKIGSALPLDADDDLPGDDDVPEAFSSRAVTPSSADAAVGADVAVRAAYLASRSSREATRAEKEALELAQLKGVLIEVAEANRLAFTTFRTLRDAVMNVPVRLRDQLAGETDAGRVEALLTSELIAALQSVDAGALLKDQDSIDGSD